MSYSSKIFKSRRTSAESSSNNPIMSQWKLPKTTRQQPVGELKGQLYDCYRTLSVEKEEIIEIRHVKYNSETILVYYPMGILIGNETIYACRAIWRKNGQKIESKKLFIGEIDFELLKKNRHYFTVLMEELLEKSRVERRAKKDDTTYIGRVKRIDANYMKYLDMNVIDECSQSEALEQKSEQLDELIEKYNSQLKTR